MKFRHRNFTHPKGGGWAEPKNGEAHFWAWGWRCGVSEANTAEANFSINKLSDCSELSGYAKFSILNFFKVAPLLVLRTHCTQRAARLTQLREGERSSRNP